MRHYIVPDNQIFGARAFEKAGVMISLGDIRGDMEGIADRMVGSIINLTRDFEKRKKMARRMRELVDGYGADRLGGSVLSGLRVTDISNIEFNFTCIFWVTNL